MQPSKYNVNIKVILNIFLRIPKKILSILGGETPFLFPCPSLILCTPFDSHTGNLEADQSCRCSRGHDRVNMKHK